MDRHHGTDPRPVEREGRVAASIDCSNNRPQRYLDDLASPLLASFEYHRLSGRSRPQDLLDGCCPAQDVLTASPLEPAVPGHSRLTTELNDDARLLDGGAPYRAPGSGEQWSMSIGPLARVFKPVWAVQLIVRPWEPSFGALAKRS